jgi:uncharacterized protein YecT (DUF1311 family)
MAKRNYVEEILSIRLRNETNARWGIALIELQALENDLRKAAEFPPEMIRYFPIAAVATMESYFRSCVKELIEFGSPYSENAMSFDKAKDLSFDFKTMLALRGRTITLGDLVGRVLPFSSLEDIDRNMSGIVGRSFLEAVKATQDRWAIEVQRESPRPIIHDAGEVYRDVKETFRLRHIYCHEITFGETVDVGLITRCFVNSTIFLKAADQLIWNLVAPNAPLTQGAMNAKSFEDFHSADQELKDLCASIESCLDDDEKREFRDAQAAWEAFRKRDAESRANRWGRGGTICPTLNSGAASTLTHLRIEQLKRELDQLAKDRAH